MIAPSEKHLEDWIVDNIAQFNPYLKIIGRQLKLPSGILDLLATTDIQNRVCVIELKKGVIDTHTVVQALRYINDLHGFYESLVCDLQSRQTIDWSEFNWAYGQERTHIEGYVVGESVASKEILYACEASGITVIKYSFDGSDYDFECITSPGARTLYKQHEKVQYPQVELALKETIFKELQRAREAGQI